MLGSLSIVVPAFNEAASIEETIADALRVGPMVATDLEVLVCNDGSRDATGELAASIAARDPRVRVLDRDVNRGIEASLRALYASARCEWVFRPRLRLLPRSRMTA